MYARYILCVVGKKDHEEQEIGEAERSDTNFRFAEQTKFVFSNTYISRTIEFYKV